MNKKWGRLQTGKDNDFSPARTNWLQQDNRGNTNLLVGNLTGLCRLRRHISFLRMEEDAMYLECAEAGESSGTTQMSECDINRLKWG